MVISYWEGLLAGAFCYADYLVLLAPSPAALHIMLCCCESFATSHLMPLKHNSFASHLIHQPHAQQLFNSVTMQRLTFVILDTLKFNFCDDDDVLLQTRDLVKKANHLLSSVGLSVVQYTLA